MKKMFPLVLAGGLAAFALGCGQKSTPESSENPAEPSSQYTEQMGGAAPADETAKPADDAAAPADDAAKPADDAAAPADDAAKPADDAAEPAGDKPAE